MQQSYGRRPMSKFDLQSNFIEIALWHGCSPVNCVHIFRTLFLKTPLGGCFRLSHKSLYIYNWHLHLKPNKIFQLDLVENLNLTKRRNSWCYLIYFNLIDVIVIKLYWYFWNFNNTFLVRSMWYSDEKRGIKFCEENCEFCHKRLFPLSFFYQRLT